jgi:hypothetical protein
MQFPSLSNDNTYVFKINRSFNNFNLFSICPKIGLEDIDKTIFKYYRIVALNIKLLNGEFCINNKKEIINDHTYKKGTFKLTYWPNFPKLDENKFNDAIDSYWVLKGEYMEICINYECIPLFPNVTIPEKLPYTDIKEFIEEYNNLDKKMIDCDIKIENDIINDKQFDEFIKSVEGNNNIDGSNQQISGSDNNGITK